MILQALPRWNRRRREHILRLTGQENGDILISRHVAIRHLSDSPPPPSLRELILPFQSSGYASEFAVDLLRRGLTEPLPYIRTRA